MKLIGLLISCAMPAARRPIDAILLRVDDLRLRCAKLAHRALELCGAFGDLLLEASFKVKTSWCSWVTFSSSATCRLERWLPIRVAPAARMSASNHTVQGTAGTAASNTRSSA